MGSHWLIALSCILLSACTLHDNPQVVEKQQLRPTIEPNNWPSFSSPLPTATNIESQVSDLLARMTLAEKVGQLMLVDAAYVTPKQVTQFNLGAVSYRGQSSAQVGQDNFVKRHLLRADQFWLASLDKQDGGIGIPILQGIDPAVGNNAILGTTVLPLHIGLGAAHDPELMFKVGKRLALETRILGADWLFSPSLAVAPAATIATAYDSYSQDPVLVAQYADKLVTAMQGELSTSDFLGVSGVIATGKHFVGSGANQFAIELAHSVPTEAELIQIQAAGFISAIHSGVQTMMVSLDNWYGIAMHGSKEILTDVLVEKLGFDGIVIGAWNGHADVKGCSEYSCPQAINAGLDMLMATENWQTLYNNTLSQVENGDIPVQRLDQAVTRILRVKLRARLFSAELPSSRPFAGEFEILASPIYKSLATEAVRKSLVLLKNNNQILPLKPTSRVMVAGDVANNIVIQTAQSQWFSLAEGDFKNKFPIGQSVYSGIQHVVNGAGGSVHLNPLGDYQQTPDVAIVVFGSSTIRRLQVDNPNSAAHLSSGLAILTKLKKQGIPTVAVFLSDRPEWVNSEINQADAFVAAWLPGTEGGGIADLLFTDSSGVNKYDFTGRLSFIWPQFPPSTIQPFNTSAMQPFLPIGYGLSLSDNRALGPLDEQIKGERNEYITRYVYAGDPVVPWRMLLRDGKGEIQVNSTHQASVAGTLLAQAANYNTAEDTVILTWNGDATFAIEGSPIDLSTQTTGDMTFQIDYRVLQANIQQASLLLGCGEGCSVSMDISESLQSVEGKGWQTALVKLSCFASSGANMSTIQTPFSISSSQGLVLQLREVQVVSSQGQANCTL